MQIAILRLTDVVASSARGQAAEERLQARIEELGKRPEEMRREALKVEAEARRLPDRREAEQKTLDSHRLRREADHAQQESGIEIDTLRRELLHDVLTEVEPLVRAIAEERKIDVVQLAPNPGLAYFNPEIDITDDVINRFDAMPGEDPVAAPAGT